MDAVNLFTSLIVLGCVLHFVLGIRRNIRIHEVIEKRTYYILERIAHAHPGVAPTIVSAMEEGNRRFLRFPEKEKSS